MAHEFIASDDNILVNVPYAEAYISSDLFREIDKESEITATIAYKNGEAITAVGVFNMRFFADEDAPRESAPLRTFNYPVPITTYPDEILENVTLNLSGTNDPEAAQKYTVLCYHRGNIMMARRIEQSSDSCEKFLSMVMKGKIPNSIPYDHLLKTWESNYEMNGLSPGVPSVIMQCILATQCRSKKDPAIPFRQEMGTGKASQTGYVFANMRTVASHTSVFNALTFEDMSAMLTTSINMTRSGTKQARSPVEKVLHV